jgi:hypothetical protein
MTSARDKAVEALARIIVGEHDWPLLNDAEAEYAEQRAAKAFDANHPALVWEIRNDSGEEWWSTRDYLVEPDGNKFLLVDRQNNFTPHPTLAAAQAAAEDHYIAQHLAGTKLWEQMEGMG